MSMPPSPPPYAGGADSVNNSKGTTALVTGIIGLVICPIIFSIIAIVFGRQGMDAAARGTANNGGMAKAGLILGIIGLVLGFAYIVIGAIAGVFGAITGN